MTPARRWTARRVIGLVLTAMLGAGCGAPVQSAAPTVPASPVAMPTLASTETDDGLRGPTPTVSLRDQLAIAAPGDGLRGPTPTRSLRDQLGPIATSAPLPGPPPTPTVPRATAMPAGSPVEQLWAIDGGDHHFNRPSRLALDPQGALHVMDTENHRVQTYDRDGRFTALWGGEGAGPGQFTFRSGLGWAGGIAVDAQGHVFVADANHRVQKFDRHGRLLTIWGSQGHGDGQLLRPGGLAVDGQGHVYVADADQHRVQKFDGDGRFLTAWGDEGAGDGQFQRPWGVAVDPFGQVYVTDTSPRVQKFDSAGRFLAAWGGAGDGPAEFKGVVSLAIDGRGLIYAADLLNHRIQVFDRDGNHLAHWGALGDGVGQFRYVGGLAVDDAGGVYAIDILNSRVVKFRVTTTWPATGRGTPTPRPPTPTPTPRPPSPPAVLPFMTPTDR